MRSQADADSGRIEHVSCREADLRMIEIRERIVEEDNPRD